MELLDRKLPIEIAELRDRGAIFIVNHSGGKDSQAMFAYLYRHIPMKQLIVIHAELGRVEWAGAVSHIEATTNGVPLLTCKSRRDLIQMIQERGMFPSPSNRQCTSDLKRGPIERTIRGTGAKLVVNCMGMRAEESPGRSKLQNFKFSDRNSKAGREWYDWLPIQDWKFDQVFEAIEAVGQKPHPIYAKGMSRFSCCFCIMANEHDLRTAAQLNPELYREYVELEKSTGHVMMMPSKKHGARTLEQITGIKAMRP